MSKKTRTPTLFLYAGLYLLGVITAAAVDGTLRALIAFAYFAVISFAALGALALLVLLVSVSGSRSRGE